MATYGYVLVMPHTTDAVKFGELPQTTRRAQIDQVRAAVAALKGRPGQWALVSTKDRPAAAKSLARKVRLGIGSWKPAGAFDATVRGLDVWAIYKGGEK
jgi:hypothetical protein